MTTISIYDWFVVWYDFRRNYREDSRDSRDTEEYYSPREYGDYGDSFERSFDQDYPPPMDHGVTPPRGYDAMTPNYDDPDMTPRGGYPDEDFIPRYSPINDGYQSPRNGRYDDDYDDRGYRGNGYDYDDYDDRYYDSRDDRYSSYDRNSYDDDGRCYDDDDRNYGSLSRGNSYSPPLMGGSSFDSPQQERRGMGSNRSNHDYNRTSTAGDYGSSRGKDPMYPPGPGLVRGQQDYTCPPEGGGGYHPDSPYHPTGRSDTDSEPLYYNSQPRQDTTAQHRPQSFMNSR